MKNLAEGAGRSLKSAYLAFQILNHLEMRVAANVTYSDSWEHWSKPARRQSSLIVAVVSCEEPALFPAIEGESLQHSSSILLSGQP